MTVVFVDQHKKQYGVESICRQVQIAPSSYYEHKARERDPDRLPPGRIKRDKALEGDIQRVWENNFKVYGANKVWRQLLRERIGVARCTVERLIKKPEIQGSGAARSVGQRLQMTYLTGQQKKLIGNL